MKKLLNTVLVLLFFSLTGNLSAQSLWQAIAEDKIPAPGIRYIIPTNYQTFALNEAALEKELKTAPLENSTEAETRTAYFTLPMPDGTFRNFKIVNSPVMAAKLGRKYPEIQTYSGYDIDKPGSTVRFDLTPQGFHAIIFTPEFGTVYIDPYSFRKKGYYIVYRKKDFNPIAGKKFVCGVVGNPVDVNDFDTYRMMGTEYGDCTKRTYRFAVAATGEYTTFHGGTLSLALAAQVTTMNRVNAVYMREMAIFMEIVPNNDLLVYTDAATDPYTNGSPNSMIDEVQIDCDAKIGSANYDIGHVFGTNSGGLAGVGVICNDTRKATGVTGSSAPVNDPFDIDYVAHELGHQFGCYHTQNNPCFSTPGTSMEPGSASTIMGYAGICAPNVQSNSDDHFHGVSLKQMSNTILGASCPALTNLNNSSPAINSVTTGLTIPGGTAFAMTADVSDAEGDMLTYCWEQMDPEASTQPPVATSTNGPNFRSNSPVADPTRYFPNLTDFLAGVSPTWEVLATVTRTFNFRLSVRDNSAAGGCSAYEDATINVDGNSGPFLVQAPSTAGISWNVASNQTVTWDVAGTSAAPVSCSNVNILLSLDGGFTYPVTLATNVPNDGSQDILTPNNTTTTARVKVVCADNIFYDISNNDFSIISTVPDFILEAVPDFSAACDVNGTTYTINVVSLLGFTDAVTLAVTGLPAGVSGAFDVNPVTPGNSAVLSLSGSTAPGIYTFEVTGTSTTGTKTLAVSLEVYEPAPAGVNLTAPANGAVDVSTAATLSWDAATGTNVTYNLEVATDPGFSAFVVNETGLTATSFSVSGLMTNTIHYWRISASNNCGAGAYSGTFSFQTSNCQIISSTDVPTSIPASGTPVVTSTLVVAGLGTITDINVVTLSGTHSYITDLVITLTSPAATAVNLFSAICDGESDFNVQFDDAATNPYTALPCPPVGGGAYQPNGSLTSLNGEDPNGTWTLTIQDNANLDGGFLNAWAIEICSDASAQLSLTCPAATTEAACQTQAAVDAAFANWLASAAVTGDCPATITNDAGAAPTVCAGGSTTVNFTATGDCDVVTCNAVFTVAAPALAVNCPADQTISGVQTQAEIDAAFATWLANGTLSGGCNATLSNDATAAPDANTGGSVTVIFTATGNCTTATCTSTFTYQATPAQLSLTCPAATTEAACQTQSAVDAAFANWLASATVTGDCPATITNDAGAAPTVCAGGSTTVNFTATGDCAVATCNAVFTVAAPALAVNCPADQTISGVQTQAAIDAAFATWLTNGTLSGGCNATLGNDATAAPDANTGGSVTVTFTATGDCTTATCMATFTYQATPGGCQIFNSTDVPIVIPDAGTPTVTSTLSVSGLSAITDINVVELSGEHSYIGDLIIDLTSPAGTTVNLLFGICSSEDDFDVQFDTDAANPYSALPCPPVGGGSYQSNSSLGAFNGEDPNGTWTLTIQDNADFDGGSLNAWAIEICTDTPPELALSCPPDANEPACQTQAAIDAAFSTWLASATATGCVATVTNDAGAAPDVCTGGSVTVNFTATGSCGTATCSAVFAVAAPSALVINCPLDENQVAGQTQAAIDAAFGSWLASVGMTGGCNATLSNDATAAPDVTTGGAATVTFTATGDCSTIACMATFTVEAPVNPCPVNMVVSDTYTTGNVLIEVSNNITSTEAITGDADISYSAGVDIVLNAGFEVTQGAQFHGYIQGCVVTLHPKTNEEAKID